MSENIEDLPRVNMTHERSVCARHGEVFRSEWPKGFAVFMLIIINEAMRNDDVMKRAQEISGEDYPNPTVVEKVFDERPACCWLPGDKVLEAYLESHKKAGLGKIDRCEACKEVRPGVPYKTIDTKYGHICFHCIIHNMEPLN